ncbi:MAG: flagellar protein FlaG [Gammaproteobacteria bacterium]|nr:MAG: flagellar protein FlaG [Gammaproteobacteria bacterium]
MNLDSVNDNLPATLSRAPAAVREGAREVAASQADAAPSIEVEIGFGPERLRAASEAITQALDRASRNLRFEVDESSGRTVVQVVETSSGEVLRQMPSEEVLRIAAQLAADGTLRSIGVDEAT